MRFSVSPEGRRIRSFIVVALVICCDSSFPDSIQSGGHGSALDATVLFSGEGNRTAVTFQACEYLTRLKTNSWTKSNEPSVCLSLLQAFGLIYGIDYHSHSSNSLIILFPSGAAKVAMRMLRKSDFIELLRDEVYVSHSAVDYNGQAFIVVEQFLAICVQHLSLVPMFSDDKVELCRKKLVELASVDYEFALNHFLKQRGSSVAIAQEMGFHVATHYCSVLQKPDLHATCTAVAPVARLRGGSRGTATNSFASVDVMGRMRRRLEVDGDAEGELGLVVLSANDTLVWDGNQGCAGNNSGSGVCDSWNGGGVGVCVAGRLQEGGGDEKLLLALSAPPLSLAVVRLFPTAVTAAGAQAAPLVQLTPATLLFTSLDWFVAQPVTATVGHDDTVSGDHVQNISYVVLSGSAAWPPQLDALLAAGARSSAGSDASSVSNATATTSTGNESAVVVCDGATAGSLPLLLLDDDRVGLIILLGEQGERGGVDAPSQRMGSVLQLSGSGSVAYSVALMSQPRQEVTVTVQLTLPASADVAISTNITSGGNATEVAGGATEPQSESESEPEAASESESESEPEPESESESEAVEGGHAALEPLSLHPSASVLTLTLHWAPEAWRDAKSVTVYGGETGLAACDVNYAVLSHAASSNDSAYNWPLYHPPSRNTTHNTTGLSAEESAGALGPWDVLLLPATESVVSGDEEEEEDSADSEDGQGGGGGNAPPPIVHAEASYVVVEGLQLLLQYRLTPLQHPATVTFNVTSDPTGQVWLSADTDSASPPLSRVVTLFVRPPLSDSPPMLRVLAVDDQRDRRALQGGVAYPAVVTITAVVHELPPPPPPGGGGTGNGGGGDGDGGGDDGGVVVVGDPPPTVSLSLLVLDNDAAGVALSHTSQLLRLTPPLPPEERGDGEQRPAASFDFTLRLTSQPAAPVFLSLLSELPPPLSGEANITLLITPSTLMFNASHWSQPQAVAVEVWLHPPVALAGTADEDESEEGAASTLGASVRSSGDLGGDDLGDGGEVAEAGQLQDVLLQLSVLADSADPKYHTISASWLPPTLQLRLMFPSDATVLLAPTAGPSDDEVSKLVVVSVLVAALIVIPALRFFLGRHAHVAVGVVEMLTREVSSLLLWMAVELADICSDIFSWIQIYRYYRHIYPGIFRAYTIVLPVALMASVLNATLRAVMVAEIWHDSEGKVVEEPQPHKRRVNRRLSEIRREELAGSLGQMLHRQRRRLSVAGLTTMLVLLEDVPFIALNLALLVQLHGSEGGLTSDALILVVSCFISFFLLGRKSLYLSSIPKLWHAAQTLSEEMVRLHEMAKEEEKRQALKAAESEVMPTVGGGDGKETSVVKGVDHSGTAAAQTAHEFVPLPSQHGAVDSGSAPGVGSSDLMEHARGKGGESSVSHRRHRSSHRRRSNAVKGSNRRSRSLSLEVEEPEPVEPSKDLASEAEKHSQLRKKRGRRKVTAVPRTTAPHSVVPTDLDQFSSALSLPPQEAAAAVHTGSIRKKKKKLKVAGAGERQPDDHHHHDEEGGR